MGDVIDGKFITRLQVPPSKVIGAAGDVVMKEVLIIGFTEDGDFYLAASEPGTPENLYLMERARHELMKMEDALYDEGLLTPPPRGA